MRRKKDKKVLYHIGVRPATPVPKMKWIEEYDPDAPDRKTGEKGEFIRVAPDNEWRRYWLDQPVKSGVFMSPNPVEIRTFHNVAGNVHAYRVPWWVIKKSGGIHRSDWGSEILISEDVWWAAHSRDAVNADNHIEYLGTSPGGEGTLDDRAQQDHASLERASQRQMAREPVKPAWMSDESFERDKRRREYYKHVEGLRSTKYLNYAISQMTDDEKRAALSAFDDIESLAGYTLDDLRSGKKNKDMKIRNAIQSTLSESILRECIRLFLPM